MKRLFLIFCSFIFLLSIGCSNPICKCPLYGVPDLSRADIFASDSQFPFRFPLDVLDAKAVADAAIFHASGWKSETKLEYHCAEDYHRPPGEPVYSITNGVVSFSGRMGGYGWLVIIDHPEINIYSLYGHLSPGRWNITRGQAVAKGDLIGYLGDDFENGGSKENPLVPHLHFGIRAGQRNEYPAKNDWRWMAGWIRLCPTELGWLQPSSVINSQTIPSGGFIKPEAPFLSLWKIEIIISAVYILGAVIALINALKKKRPKLLFIYCALIITAGIFFRIRLMNIGFVIWAIASILFIIAVVQIRRGNLKK